MPYLRIVRGVTEHFRARAPEWALSIMMIIWGVIVYAPGDTFTTPAWAVMQLIASERTWGVCALLIGGLRLIALIMNGTFWQTWYGRLSPHIRAVMAFLSCFVWLQISIGLAKSDAVSTGLAIYPLLLALDLYNGMSASHDAGAMDRMRRDGDA